MKREKYEGAKTRREFLRAAAGAIGVAAGAKASRSQPIGEDSVPHKVFDVRDFGAKGDGQAFDTAAINASIDAAAAAGGGTVNVPAGDYLCYSVHLKSKVQLFLSDGATLVAADPPAP